MPYMQCDDDASTHWKKTGADNAATLETKRGSKEPCHIYVNLPRAASHTFEFMLLDTIRESMWHFLVWGSWEPLHVDQARITLQGSNCLCGDCTTSSGHAINDCSQPAGFQRSSNCKGFGQSESQDA